MSIRLVIFVLLLLAVSGCSLTSHINSNHHNGERTELTMLPMEQPKGLLPVGPLALALAPEVIDLAAGGLRTYFTERAEEYIAGWGTTYVGEDFYSSDTSLEFAHRGFEVRRYAQDKSGREQMAATLKFRYRLNEEHTLFSILPEYVQLKKAKARIAAGDPTADLLVEVSLNGWWKDRNGSIKSRKLGEASLLLRNINLYETYSLGESGGNYYLEDSRGNKSNYNVQSQWMIPVPVSVSAQGNRIEHSRGNYTLTVNITEMDEAGERIRKTGETIYDSRGLIKDLVNEID